MGVDAKITFQDSVAEQWHAMVVRYRKMSGFQDLVFRGVPLLGSLSDDGRSAMIWVPNEKTHRAIVALSQELGGTLSPPAN